MTGTWVDGPMAGFDLETTGVDPMQARIVTACVVSVQTEPVQPPRQWLVNPGVEIPAEAAAVHGVTTERAVAEGSDPAVSAKEIHEALTSAWDSGLPVVIYNAPYDLTVLDQELLRHCGTRLGTVGPVIDPLVLDRHVDRYRRGSRRLDAASRHYGVALDGAHDSTQDALAATRVAWRIGRMFPEIGGATLDGLHALQAKAHASWAAGFQAHLAAKGSSEVVSVEWPVRGGVA